MRLFLVALGFSLLILVYGKTFLLSLRIWKISVMSEYGLDLCLGALVKERFQGHLARSSQCSGSS
jgi:hypothetical protein